MSLNRSQDDVLALAPSAFPGRLMWRAHALMNRLARGAIWLAPIAGRFALAIPFLRSGLTKWSAGLHVSPAAAFLFESIFKLHLFGHLYDFPVPDLLAHLDAVAEVVLPILLMAGLGTRLSAAALLVMVGVIQLTVPSGWVNFHLPWAAIALGLIALGPGPLSLDGLISWWLARRPSRGEQRTSARA